MKHTLEIFHVGAYLVESLYREMPKRKAASGWYYRIRLGGETMQNWRKDYWGEMTRGRATALVKDFHQGANPHKLGPNLLEWIAANSAPDRPRK